MSRVGTHPKWIPLEKAKGKKITGIGSGTLGQPVREMDICINFTDGTSLVVKAKAELMFEFWEKEE